MLPMALDLRNLENIWQILSGNTAQCIDAMTKPQSVKEGSRYPALMDNCDAFQPCDSAPAI